MAIIYNWEAKTVHSHFVVAAVNIHCTDAMLLPGQGLQTWHQWHTISLHGYFSFTYFENALIAHTFPLNDIGESDEGNAPNTNCAEHEVSHRPISVR